MCQLSFFYVLYLFKALGDHGSSQLPLHCSLKQCLTLWPHLTVQLHKLAKEVTRCFTLPLIPPVLVLNFLNPHPFFILRGNCHVLILSISDPLGSSFFKNASVVHQFNPLYSQQNILVEPIVVTFCFFFSLSSFFLKKFSYLLILYFVSGNQFNYYY